MYLRTETPKPALARSQRSSAKWWTWISQTTGTWALTAASAASIGHCPSSAPHSHAQALIIARTAISNSSRTDLCIHLKQASKVGVSQPVSLSPRIPSLCSMSERCLMSTQRLGCRGSQNIRILRARTSWGLKTMKLSIQHIAEMWQDL